MRINGSRILVTAILGGAVALGGSALTSAASAVDNPGVPGQAGCTYAGSDYSHGSTRQQVKHHSNGPDTWENYECRNGAWVYTGMSRVGPKGTVMPPRAATAGVLAPPRG